jgi:hypothetical protein
MISKFFLHISRERVEKFREAWSGPQVWSGRTRHQGASTGTLKGLLRDAINATARVGPRGKSSGVTTVGSRKFVIARVDRSPCLWAMTRSSPSRRPEVKGLPERELGVARMKRLDLVPSAFLRFIRTLRTALASLSIFTATYSGFSLC